MKKIFKISLVYLIGILVVLSFSWRASSLDKNSLSKNVAYDSNYNIN